MSRSLAIFDTDPDAKPRPRFVADTVGRFRSGRMIGNRPESLSEWRVTTGDPDTAKAITALMGGTSEEWETAGEDGLEILTDKDAVKIVIDGVESIRARMVLWGRQGPIHECDGAVYLSPDEDKGTPCGCPKLLADRKAAAKSGRGPAPSIELKFRLADDPTLGKFKFVSGSWELVKVLHEVENALERVGGPALCTLRLELVEFTTKAGVDVAYRKPVIDVHGKVPADIDAVINDASPWDDVPF
ncbi:MULTISPECIES: recombination directionality factor [Streptomyces]|uniref:Uncharacterized protein n=2 Tax=Streptomyces TaxID=1883 RepID=A0A1E7LPS9_9ACTN|nr:hypothetical protein [Streptomyces nanshensis]OEV18168.1 hypothetical protein AN221_23800 [Streptomyces nanshensis]